MAAKAAIHDKSLQVRRSKTGKSPAALDFLNFERRSCGPLSWMAAFAAMTALWGYASEVLFVGISRFDRR